MVQTLRNPYSENRVAQPLLTYKAVLYMVGMIYLIFLLTKDTHLYVLIMNYCTGIDKKGILLQEYFKPPILPSFNSGGQEITIFHLLILINKS